LSIPLSLGKETPYWFVACERQQQPAALSALNYQFKKGRYVDILPNPSLITGPAITA
jgi:ribosomal protein L21E